MRISLTSKQIEEARYLRIDRGLSYQTIADQFGCAKRTVYDALNADKCTIYRVRGKNRALATRKRRGETEEAFQIPDQVKQNWLARAIEFSRRTNPTAIIMGDPLRDVCALYNADRR